ncbi:DUF5050 domain-containing protein [Wukongibacter baidiensis]|uniref:DUF5050 domain-containing protein n=1 Tax=Wukongibacter baidiensis TaxID=1723361 RepID=UPI003D7F561C
MIVKKKLSLIAVSILLLIILTIFATSDKNSSSKPIHLGEINVGTGFRTTEHAAKSENNIYLYKNTFSPKVRCVSLKDSSSKLYDTLPLTDFLVTNDWIYYVNTDNYGPSFTLLTGPIYRISKDGTVNEKISDEDVSLVAADSEWLYYTDTKVGNLHKMSYDGMKRIELSAYSGANYTLIDNQIYYRSMEDESSLYRFNINTEENTKIVDEGVNGYYISEGYIYYMNSSDEKIYRVNLDGRNKEKITDQKLYSFIVKDDWIYGVDLDFNKGSKLYRVKTNGTELRKIADNANLSISNIFAYEDWIFYINSKDNRTLYKVKMDGSENVRVTNSINIKTFRYSNDSVYFIDECRDNYLYGIDENSSNISLLSNEKMRHITITDDWIFYTNPIDSNKLYKVKKDGTKKTKITNDNLPIGFMIDGDWIYYTNHGERGRKYKIKVDGSNRSIIKNEPIFSLSVNKGWIYFVKGDSDRDGTIHKMKADGSNEKKLGNDLVPTIGINGIQIIDDWIYYINKSDNGNLYRMKIDGSDRTKITDRFVSGMIIIDDWIYYYQKEADDFDFNTYKIRTNGKDETKIDDYKWLELLRSKIYNGCVYYKKYSDGNLYKMKTDGTEETMILNDSINAFSIVDDWIYYSLSNESNVYRIKIDGTSKELIE